MTPEEAVIRARHYPLKNRDGTDGLCAYEELTTDDLDYPCDAAVLLEVLDAARADADRLAEALRMFRDAPPIDSTRGKMLDAALADHAALAAHEALVSPTPNSGQT